jgi:hypothetical protein
MADTDRDVMQRALSHLGDVLSILANLTPDDRCQALDEALAFYNEHRPDAKVVAEPGWVTKLVTEGPLDRLR